MKMILVLFFSSVFILCADWQMDVMEINSNIDDMKDDVARSESSLVSIWSALYAQSHSLGLSYTMPENMHHTPLYSGETLPSGLQGIANKYDIIKDNTNGYNSYVTSRRLGTSNKAELNINSTSGDAFLDYEFSYKNIDTVDNEFYNKDGVGIQYMYENTETLYQTRQIVNRAATLINGYLNTSYEDYTFFKLDLTSLGGMLQNWGLVEGTVNPFENWIFKCNLVPDEQENPFLFKIHSSLQNFYNVYYGKFIIQICFSMYLVMLLWHKVINVFNID